MASNGLNNFWFQIVDELGDPVTSGLSVEISSAFTALTVYADSASTAKSNPIRGTITNGVVSFWYDGDTIDVEIVGQAGSIRKKAMTVHDHRIVYNVAANVISPPMIELFDDFHAFDPTATVGIWQTLGDSEIVGMTDASGGVLSCATRTASTADNDIATVASMNQVFKFQTNKKLTFEARVSLDEANTDGAGIFVGLADDVADDHIILEEGLLLYTDGDVDCAGFFKLNGTTTWQFHTSNAQLARTNGVNTDVGTFTDAAWHVLRFDYDYNDGTTASITPYVNGVAADPVALLIAGLSEMNIVFNVRNDSAAVETLLIDYVRVTQER